ncbi:MAG TPA: hypothetical protein VN702_07485 [Acetobacteraceae bacterium]|nr:hypothetical protein [Acetobacteraceae bacterium]
MRNSLHCVALLLALGMLATPAAHAAPTPFDLNLDLPPVIGESTKPPDCTIVYLTTDTSTDDVYAERMMIEPSDNAVPVAGRMPCPARIPPKLADQAMADCEARAADPKHCVFADMSRGFERERSINNTAENTARCASDTATDIGIACWKSGTLDVCNVGCGQSVAEAVAQARRRCEAKHRQSCPLTGSLPIIAATPAPKQ